MNDFERRIRLKQMEGSITEPQKKYLDGLLLDCGFITRGQRNGFLSRAVQFDIHFLDDLTKREATQIISDLVEHSKRLRENQKQ